MDELKNIFFQRINYLSQIIDGKIIKSEKLEIIKSYFQKIGDFIIISRRNLDSSVFLAVGQKNLILIL
jgi:hypothetical protein